METEKGKHILPVPTGQERGDEMQAALSRVLKRGSDQELLQHAPSALTEMNLFFKGLGLPLNAIHEWGIPFGEGGYDFVFLWLRYIREHYHRQGVTPWFLWIQGPWPQVPSRHFSSRTTKKIHTSGTANQKQDRYRDRCLDRSMGETENNREKTLNNRAKRHYAQHLFAGAERFYPLYWQRSGLPMHELWVMEAPQSFHDILALFFSPVFKVVIFDRPGFWRPGDWSFLAERARSQRQTCFVLQPFLVQESRGNPWVRSRLNILRHRGRLQQAGINDVLQVQAVKGCGPNHLNFSPQTDLSSPLFTLSESQGYS